MNNSETQTAEGNEEWTIQRHRQQWVQDTERIQAIKLNCLSMILIFYFKIVQTGWYFLFSILFKISIPIFTKAFATN